MKFDSPVLVKCSMRKWNRRLRQYTLMTMTQVCSTEASAEDAIRFVRHYARSGHAQVFWVDVFVSGV